MALSGAVCARSCPAPRVHGFEERLMRCKHIAIGKMLDLREVFERLIEFRQKRSMLEPLDDFEVFFSRDVSQVSTRFEITERIEGHGFA